MRITQGTFSFLPDLTDEEIRAQIDYAIEQGWAIGVEYTDDPHPRNFYWEMWGNPQFDLNNSAGVMREVLACREKHGNLYVRVIAFDSTRGFETTRLSFIVNRPADEPGFLLKRHEVEGRHIQYTLESYATQAPAGRRYE
jgi:ribulose-bisphosphate carboxylase small chain